MSDKTIRVNANTHQLIQKAARKRNMTIRDYVSSVMTIWATDDLEEIPRELDPMTLAHQDMQASLGGETDA